MNKKLDFQKAQWGLSILLGFLALINANAVWAVDLMAGAKFYNARFCEPEEAYADQVGSMRGLNGFTNTTNEFITVTCPVIRMQDLHEVTFHRKDGTSENYPA